MRRNTLRIVCNPYTDQISYYFKSERGEWDVLSGNSPLSRQYYTNTSMKTRAKEIVAKADEIYNRKNKGLDILFEGSTDEFKCLKSAVDLLSERDICCNLGTTKIAVIGKKSVGKTYLIEGLEELHRFKYTKEIKNGYSIYSDECNHAQWYEIDGIDLGKDKIDVAFKTVADLAKEGLTAVIYCISGTAGRIEDIEKNLIKKISEEFSQITIMVVLTLCCGENLQSTYDEIKKITGQIKIVQTLAKPYKTRGKMKNGENVIMKPFGLEEVSKFVFEGR